MNCQTPTKNDGNNAAASTPSSKRTIEFDYWNVASQDGADDAKKLKVESPSESPKDMKIADLTLGTHFDENLVFRVTMKKIFKNEGSGGVRRTLKFNGMDHSGEVAFVGFESEFEKFVDLIKMDRCYQLMGFQVIEESANYPNYTGSRFVVRLTAGSTLTELVSGNEAELPPIAFQFLTIDGLSDVDVGKRVDILGVVAVNWGLQDYGKRSRRYLTLVDKTGQLRVTLWNQMAEEFGDDDKIVVALRNAVVEKYEDRKCLNTYYYTTIWANPSVKTDDLASWFSEKDKERELMMKKQAEKC